MPPGHFIAGKSARLQQFALTPEQLYQREVRTRQASNGLCMHQHHRRLASEVFIDPMYYIWQVYESHMDDEGSPPPASPMSPGRMPENSSLSSVHSNFDSDALFRISLDM